MPSPRLVWIKGRRHLRQDAEAARAKAYAGTHHRLLECQVRAYADTKFLHTPMLRPMAPHPVLICPANFSEGRDPGLIHQIQHAASTFATVADVHQDPDHNRCVVTIVGSADRLVPALVAASTKAVHLLDIRGHSGVHPRIGSVDVVPFVPWGGSSMADAIDAAKRFSDQAWEQIDLPSFFYDAASSKGLTLPEVRRRAFSDLLPDRGEGPHPSAGAVAVGARPPMVAFNMMLSSSDLDLGSSIAKQLRVPGKIRALAFFLPSRQAVQVSMNLLDPVATTMGDAFDRVVGLASAAGVDVTEAELVGLAPKGAFGGRKPSDLRMTKEAKVLEEELERFGEC